MAVVAAMAHDFEVDGIYYNIIGDNEASVAYNGTSSSVKYDGKVVIPASVIFDGNNYSVTSIGRNAFYDCTSLTSITLPNSVTSIGSYAFSGCGGLTSITLPNSVTYIGTDAFYKCTSLTSITLPNSVTSIGSYAFYDCTSLTSITLPNSVTSIGSYAFYDCTSLTSIELPNSVTSIGDWTFSGCSGLTSVTIPNSVTYIGDWTFSGCSGLTSVTIPNSVTYIGESAFSSCANLTSIVVKAGNATYDSRDNCNAIIRSKSNTLISGCSITNIPNSVTSIGNYAFFGCGGLTSITIPNSVTSIGNRALRGCTGLTSIVVESGNATYDSRDNCNAIIESATNTLIIGCKSTNIPNSVSSIGKSAFEDCTSLTSVTIPESVTSIGGYAFYACTGLTSIEIPNSVITIGESAFRHCRGLTSVTIPESVTSIGGYAFLACTGLTSIEIPNSVTSIGESAFSNCTGLTSVNIGNSVTAIGESAFYYCGGLTSVNIPNSVITIGECAFGYCSGLTSVNIGNSVTTIGGDVFVNCTGLTSIEIPNTVTSIGSAAFCGCTGLTSIKIPNSVRSIAGFVFANCRGLTSVSIPNSVASIETFAFYCCSGLTSIELPNSVTSIGTNAFCGCTGLTSIEIPNSVISIDRRAFQYCSGLTSIELPNSVTSIGDWAFRDCSGLKSIYCDIEAPLAISGEVFSNYDVDLFVPERSIGAYKSTDPWQRFNVMTNHYMAVDTIYHLRGTKSVTVDVPIMLYNRKPITGMQFEIKLPAEVAIASYGGAPNIWLDDARKGRNHSVAVSEQNDGSLLVLVSSPTNRTFSGYSGAVLHMNLILPQYHQAGDSLIQYNNIVLTEPDMTEHIVPNTTSVVRNTYVLGDANADVSVDVSDYTTTALAILHRAPARFYSDAADVSEDGNVNVTDLAGITNIALGIKEQETRPFKAPSANAENEGAWGTFAIDAAMCEGAMEVNLRNDRPLAGMQMELTLPRGVRLSKAELLGRAACHELAVETMSDGRVLLLVSTFSAHDIEAGDDAVLRLVLRGGDGKEAMVALEHIVMVERSLAEHVGETVRVPIVASGLNYLDDNALNLTSREGTIIIDAASDGVAQLVRADGVVQELLVRAGHNEFPFYGHGVVIVRMGNRSAKLAY